MFYAKYVITMFALCLPLAACSDDLPSGEEDLLIETSGIDKAISVVNVNFFKGAFGEGWRFPPGHNPPETRTDAANFLYYLASNRFVPDIFTVQNLKHDQCGFHDCEYVKRELEESLRPRGVNYVAYYPSEPGGACVIYRKDRFERDTVKVFDGRVGTNCAPNGMKSVGIRLRDKFHDDAIISVISVHMPGDCTKRNTNELIDWADGGNTQISIIAGDFNTHKLVPGRQWGSIPALKKAMKKHSYRVAPKIWGELDWIWRKGYSKVRNSRRIARADAKGPEYPSSLDYSDHEGGWEVLFYKDDPKAALEKIAESPEQDSAPDDLPALEESPEQDSDDDLPALADMPALASSAFDDMPALTELQCKDGSPIP